MRVLFLWPGGADRKMKATFLPKRMEIDQGEVVELLLDELQQANYCIAYTGDQLNLAESATRSRKGAHLQLG